MNKSGDVFMISGIHSDIVRVKSLLPDIDIRQNQVLVTAYIFEVQTNERNGSGLALAASLLNGKFNIKFGDLTQNFNNVISFKSGGIDMIYQLFRTDNRFHVVSSPQLRVNSGEKGLFSVGSEVPVLGSVTYQDRDSVQSIDYRENGVIFNVTPKITENAINLNIDQQLSNFVKTETGVSDSPTLIKRQVTTTVNVSDNDIVILGGLAENKDSAATTGFSFLPKSWFDSQSDEKNKTDIIVILQARRV
ncbi:type II secretion system protein GspD [Citrobacter sp.]|uniref:type II secretion system protein GspD n=1 Tax=Citrobacter sp. TaxID=1896336 RepID=UPI002FC99E86